MSMMTWMIKHIFDGDYGCEELQFGEKAKVSVTLVNEEGKTKIVSVEDQWLFDKNLSEGSIWPEQTPIFEYCLSPQKHSLFHEGKFEGWGTSFCWWANRIGYSDELSEQAARLFFDPKEGLGLTIVRYNIGGGDDPTHHHITRTDSMVPGYAVTISHDAEGYRWSYDWSADENQRNVLRKVAERYGENLIVEGFSNSPPYFMTNSGCSSGAQNAGTNNLREDAYGAFAAYLADVAKHFSDEWGIRFQSMTAMNEPDTEYWHAFSEKQEGCHFDPGESQSVMILSLREALDERGLSDILISGTDETGIDLQKNSICRLSEAAREVIDRIDTHSYLEGDSKGLRNLAQEEQKNLWMSEVDGGNIAGCNAGEMGAALWLANKIVSDINGLLPSAWVLWQVIDSHISRDGYLGNTDSGKPDYTGGYWGLATADHDAKKIILTMKYYAMGQFSRYIRPNDTILQAGDRTVAAWNPQERKLVLVLVNDSDQTQNCRFDLSEFALKEAVVQPIRTSGSIDEGECWKQLDAYTLEGTVFETQLKANSITTFIIRENLSML